MDDLDHCLSRLLVAPQKIHKGNTHMELDKVDPGTKKCSRVSWLHVTPCYLRFPNAFKTKNCLENPVLSLCFLSRWAELMGRFGSKSTSMDGNFFPKKTHYSHWFSPADLSIKKRQKIFWPKSMFFRGFVGVCIFLFNPQKRLATKRLVSSWLRKQAIWNLPAGSPGVVFLWALYQWRQATGALGRPGVPMKIARMIYLHPRNLTTCHL